MSKVLWFLVIVLGLIVFFTYKDKIIPPKEIPQQPAETPVSSPPIIHNKGLMIAQWNVKFFGEEKSHNPEITKVLVDKINQYDLITFQEITDSDGTAFPYLMSMMPAKKYVISKRVGRTDYKEQYAFIYDPIKVDIIETFVYPDNEDNFEREPFIAHIKNKINGKTFAMIQIHTKPLEADKEIPKLEWVAQYTTTKWNESNIIIIGDLNADCTYLTRTTELKDMQWIVPDEADTTVGNSNCAYDRIVTKNVGVFNWSIERDTSIDVSDHYLIWGELV